MILAALLAAQVTLPLSPCQLEGVPGEARCGTQSVRENRDAPLGGPGRMVGLSVIVLSALEPDKLPDPFFMLAGGPGDAPSFNARFFSRVFHDIRRKRDIVLVDLRGTGKSSPLLCPELGQPGANGIYDENLLSIPALRACRQRLDKTTDLSAVHDRNRGRRSRASPADGSDTGRSIFTAPRMDRASRRSTCVAIRTAFARWP